MPSAPRPHRVRGRRRAVRGVIGCLAALALLAASLSRGAEAASAPGDGSSEARAAAVTAGTQLSLTSKVSLLGGLLGTDTITGPLTNAVVTPLANALLALPNTITTNLANALVGVGFAARSTDGQQQRPASGFPTCGMRGWDSTNCFGPLLPAVAAPPAVILATGATQGYATGDATGYVAGARVANPNLTLLGFPLGDLGVIESTASCKSTASSCSATQAINDGSLLQGKLALSFAQGGGLIAKINGVTVPAAGQTITVAGFSVNVKVDGNLATLTVTLGLSQLLAAAGLSDLLSAASGLGVLTDDGTAATMTIKLGPGAVTQSSPASAWGLAVTADLTVAVKLKLLSLLGISLASVSITSGTTPASLVDLKLAYTAATAGSLQPGWIPPALV